MGFRVEFESVENNDNAIVLINVPLIDLICPVPEDAGPAKQQDVAQHEGGASLVLPYQIRLALDEVSLRLSESDITTLHRIYAEVVPVSIDKSPLNCSSGRPAVRGDISVGKIENALVKVDNLQVSWIIDDPGLSTVHCFTASTELAEVTAGFSTIDWRGMFGSKKPRKKDKPIQLPFAQIAEFPVRLSYKGKVLSLSETSVTVRAFQGGDLTSSDDIIQYVTKIVLRKAPSFVTNAQFLGESVTESMAKSTGRLMMSSSITGSVTGLVAIDALKGAISSGKKGRGVSHEDGYKFDDVTRGSIRALGETAKTGGLERRGSSAEYSFGDFSSGASKSVGQYTAANKPRLAGAGGSGLGMVIGTVIAGPIGLVAGSYLGGRMGSKTFDSPDKNEISGSTQGK